MQTNSIRRDRGELRTLMVPGLQGSGPAHWQSLWQEDHPDYECVVQSDWMNPELEVWARALADKIDEHSGPVLLAAHSFGCLAAVRAHALRPGRIAGALLVAPAHPRKFSVEHIVAESKLDENWILVASRNDPWIMFEHARELAARWSSRFVDAGQAGHIDAAAGYGAWAAGERLVDRLRSQIAGASSVPRSLAA